MKDNEMEEEEEKADDGDWGMDAEYETLTKCPISSVLPLK